MKQKTKPIGFHNENFEAAKERLMRGNTYKDCSTAIFTPTRGMMHVKVSESHRNLIRPMNQSVAPFPIIGHEVGQAYEQMVDIVRANEQLKKWKYVLTLEDDNIPPPDALLKLIEDINGGPWAAVGALYWTKGEGGQPMCYGKPNEMPKNFIPWLPDPNSVAECNGLGMGCTLFKMSMLQDTRFERPMFKTLQEYIPGQGTRMFTQDLLFFQNAAKLGYRFACSTRVLVGHFDVNANGGEGFCW